MILQFSDCVMSKVETPNIVLRAINILMRFYPAVLKASQLLDRFVRWLEFSFANFAASGEIISRRDAKGRKEAKEEIEKFW